MTDVINQIRERLSALEKTLGDLEASAKVLRGERDELLLALQVYGRFSGEPETKADASPAPVGPPRGTSYGGKRRLMQALECLQAEAVAPVIESRKPSDMPSIPEMISEVLLRPHLLGDEGMEPKEILAKIRQRWWPEAPSTSVGSVAWRMANDGRLIKRGNLYALPEDNGPKLDLKAPEVASYLNETGGDHLSR